MAMKFSKRIGRLSTRQTALAFNALLAGTILGALLAYGTILPVAYPQTAILCVMGAAVLILFLASTFLLGESREVKILCLCRNCNSAWESENMPFGSKPFVCPKCGDKMDLISTGAIHIRSTFPVQRGSLGENRP